MISIQRGNTATGLDPVRSLAPTAGRVGLALALLVAPLVEGRALAEGAPKVKVAFMGDSLAQNYWAGMRRLVARDSCLKAVLDLGNYTKPATGISRADYFNWFDEARRVNSTYNPTLTLLSIGLNDRQGIIDPKGVITQMDAPGWNERYRQLVGDFLAAVTSTKPIVLFVGLPAMRAAYFQKDMAARSATYREAVAKLNSPRVKYVEPWRANPSGPDVYESHGLDKNGKRVQFRLADGVHLTGAGEDSTAAYLLPKIVAALGEAGIKVEQCPDAKPEQTVTEPEEDAPKAPPKRPKGERAEQPRQPAAPGPLQITPLDLKGSR